MVARKWDPIVRITKKGGKEEAIKERARHAAGGRAGGRWRQLSLSYIPMFYWQLPIHPCVASSAYPFLSFPPFSIPFPFLLPSLVFPISRLDFFRVNPNFFSFSYLPLLFLTLLLPLFFSSPPLSLSIHTHTRPASRGFNHHFSKLCTQDKNVFPCFHICNICCTFVTPFSMRAFCCTQHERRSLRMMS